MPNYKGSCVCGGSNENCANCFGTGVPQGRLAMAPDKPRAGGLYRGRDRASMPERLGITLPDSPTPGFRKKRGKAAKRKAADAGNGRHFERRRGRAIGGRNGLVACPHCPAQVKATRIQGHCEKVHRSSYLAAPAEVSRKRAATQDLPTIYGSNELVASSPGTGQGEATAAGVSYKAVHQSPHSEAVAMSRNERAETRNAGNIGARNKMVVCPRCRTKVKTTRIGRHFKKVHHRTDSVRARPVLGPPRKMPKITAKRAEGVAASSAEPRAREIPISREEQTQRERRMDSTRDYAHPYRESGRFGSHPSHDNFGDESGPD
jgi:hypothetical protein